MIQYIIGIFLLMSIYNEVRFFIIKRRIRKPIPIMKGAEPYFHKRGKKGVLLIHGFTSTPRDFRFLVPGLLKNNLTVYCPLLPGHGTSPEHLSVIKWYEWMDELNASIELLKQHCDSIFIIGSSLGGNMAFILAENNKYVNGIVSLGTPIKFKVERISKLLLVFLKRIKLFQKKYSWGDQKETFDRHWAYKVIPLKSLKDVFILIKKSKKSLQNITQPTLIMQSRTDRIIDESSVSIIYDTIKSKVKEIVWVKRSYHVVVVGRYRKQAIKIIQDFIKKNA